MTYMYLSSQNIDAWILPLLLHVREGTRTSS